MTPEDIARALIDEEVLASGIVAYNETPAEFYDGDLVANIFVAMMAVLISREQTA